MTLEQIVNALQILRTSCGTTGASYQSGFMVPYNVTPGTQNAPLS
jgi:hypothetical protein